MIFARKKVFAGIEAPHKKGTQEYETIVMPVPNKVIIPMLQHIGAPCKVIVNKGERVKVGQKIGDSDSYVSAPIHSSVSGIVKEIRSVLYANGSQVDAIEIETDGLQDVYEEIRPIQVLDKSQAIKSIRESGLVGLGGAGFPTAVKLYPPPDKKIDTIIINGAECEPYITSDYREMIENPQRIIDGTKFIVFLTGAERAIIGIEANKPKAIKKLSELIKDEKNISIATLPVIYPQGGEKQLIYSTTGRKVPVGKLPSDVGVIVHNVNSVSFIAQYISTGMPLIKKKVTVDGPVVNEPKNLEVLIGTPLRDVFEFCGGFKDEPGKIIMGGPMMGVAQFSLDNSVLKQTNALLAFNKEDAYIDMESVCIRCGKCINTCPMGLLPVYINANVTKGFIQETLKYNVNDCIECGCCSFSCPAKRHIVQSIRYAKSELRKMSQAK